MKVINTTHITHYRKHRHHRRKTVRGNIMMINVPQQISFMTYFNLELIHFKYSAKYDAMVSKITGCLMMAGYGRNK
jgi:hypothetical protein